MVPIALYDRLSLQPNQGGEIRVFCRWAAEPGSGGEATLGTLPHESENLVTRALRLLQARSGSKYGACVHLVKSIPAAAGLGGGSSDAAAALLAANQAWKLNWRIDELVPIAAELGSDVPFFLYRGAAVCRGRGEKIELLGGLGRINFVVVRPPEGLATAPVYNNCRVPAQPNRIEPLLAALRRGDLKDASKRMCNRLEPAAATISPWIKRLRDEFAKVDCLAARMSGSGSSYFGICRHARHATRVAGRLRSRGVGRVFAVCS